MCDCFQFDDVGYDGKILRQLYEVRCSRHNNDIVLYYAAAAGENVQDAIRQFICNGCGDCPLAYYDANGEVVEYC